MAEVIGDELSTLLALPSLQPFITHLNALLCSPFPPSSIHLQVQSNLDLVRPLLHHLLSSTPSTCTTTTPPSIQQLLPSFGWVDLTLVHSLRQATDLLLNQLSGWEGGDARTWDSERRGVANWDGRTQGWSISPSSHQVEWDRTLPPPSLAANQQPLPNTPEHFLHSLQLIASLGSPPSTASSSSSSSSSSSVAPRNPFAAREGDGHRKRRLLVFQNAEFLSELATAGTVGGAPRETGLGMTLEGVLRRAGELSGLPLTTITISALPMSKMRGDMVGLVEPVVLVFPDLSNCPSSSSSSPASPLPDPVTLLLARFSLTPSSHPSPSPSPPTTNPNGSPLLTRAELLHLFTELARLVYDLFGKYWGGEVGELGAVCARAWGLWKGVVEGSRPPIHYTNTSALHNHLKPHFQREREMIGLSSSSSSHSAAPPPPSTTTSAPPPPQHQQKNSFTASLLASSSSSSSNSNSNPSTSFSFLGSLPALPQRPRYLDEQEQEQDPSLEVGGGARGMAQPGAQGTSTQGDVFGSPSTSMPNSPNSPSSNRPQPPLSSLTLTRSLPHLARWLLLASFYAAFNPPKTDVRVFVRVDEGVVKRGRKGRARGGRGLIGRGLKAKLGNDLAGGKVFSLERLLAIFETLVVERLEVESWAQGDGVYSQIASLLSLRLLTRASSSSSSSSSGGDKVLDGVKLRCNVGREQVEVLARSLGFSEWAEMLVEGE